MTSPKHIRVFTERGEANITAEHLAKMSKVLRARGVPGPKGLTEFVLRLQAYNRLISHQYNNINREKTHHYTLPYVIIMIIFVFYAGSASQYSHKESCMYR
jgi:hypothetical protein